jgi:hypothetical protein
MEGQFPWVSENRRTKTVIKPKLNKWHPKETKQVRLKETKQVKVLEM